MKWVKGRLRFTRLLADYDWHRRTNANDGAHAGKPVITSNSALMYDCLKRLEIDMHGVEAGGYLFTRRN